MRALKLGLATLMFLAAGAAGADQIYKWIDKDGKVHYGDRPSAGAKTTSISAPAAPAGSPAAPAAANGKAAAKDSKPLTPAEQEQAFRKRQADAAKAADKAEKERADQAAKADNCERAKENLRQIESGQRIARLDANGERYFVDDEQRAQEAAKVREAMQKSCN